MSDSVQHFELYGGEVQLDFNPDSPRYRYVVTDRRAGTADVSVRGVTSVLKDIIAKPDLLTWPMNMATQYLFGATWDDGLKKYFYNPKKAAVIDGTSYTAQELQELMEEASRQWIKRSDKGKDVGTLTHEAVEAYIKGESMNYPEDEESQDNVKLAKKASQTFKTWWERLEDPEVISTEKPVYSRMMNYCGTYDLLAKINGKTYLLDLKTTNVSKKAPMGIYTEYFLQLGAYAHAVTEETGQTIDDVGIIRVGKDGRLFVATAKDIGIDTATCERAFAFAVRLHDMLETATPFLQDAHFKSHILPSPELVDSEDSASKKEA